MAEGETVVAGLWSEKLQRVAVVRTFCLRGDICLGREQSEGGRAT